MQGAMALEQLFIIILLCQFLQFTPQLLLCLDRVLTSDKKFTEHQQLSVRLCFYKLLFFPQFHLHGIGATGFRRAPCNMLGMEHPCHPAKKSPSSLTL